MPPLIWLENRRPFQWVEVHLPLEVADALLKAEGFDGAYDRVLLHEMVFKGRPLQYCFQFPGRPQGKDVVVEVETGRVWVPNYSCFIEVNNE